METTAQTSSPKPSTRTSRMRSNFRRSLWLLMTFLCLLFAPTAAEFYVVNATHGTATYAQLLALVVSDAYAYGPESGFAIMTPYWRAMPSFNQIILGLHALLASVVLVLGPFLFSRTVRRRWPSSHRYLGRTYVSLGVVAMVLSVLYLAITPMDKIYGGPPFAFGLWGIAILTLYTLIVGAWHIVRGEVHEHRAIMILNFSAMLIAPLLRLWWAVLGRLFNHDPSIMQEETHVAVLMFLGLETMVGAIVVVLLLNWNIQRRPSSAAINAFRLKTLSATPRLARVASALGLIAALVLIHQSLLRFFGAPDILGHFRPDAIAKLDLLLVSGHPLLITLETLALAALFLLTPQLLKRLFLSPDTHATRLLTAAFSVLTLVAAGSWVLKALALGRDGVAGWGSAFFWAALAAATLLLFVAWTFALRRRASRQLRELTLHLYALSLAPMLLGLIQTLLLFAGMTWTDAFLSGAVASTSLALSSSYYYTVYSGAPSHPTRLNPA